MGKAVILLCEKRLRLVTNGIMFSSALLCLPPRALFADVSIHSEKNCMDYGLFPLILPLCILLLISVMSDTLGMPILSKKSVVSFSSAVNKLMLLIQADGLIFWT